MLPTPLRLVRTIATAHVVLLSAAAVLGLGLAAVVWLGTTAGDVTGVGRDPEDWSGWFVFLGLTVAGVTGAPALFLGATIRLLRGAGGPPAVTALVLIVLLEAVSTLWTVPTALQFGGSDIAVLVGLVGVSSVSLVLLALHPRSLAWASRSWRATPARPL